MILTIIVNQDYSFQQMTLTFSKDNTRQCFDVYILDDDLNEPEEILFVILTTDDPQVTLSSDKTTITILDNDGKYQFQAAEFIRPKDIIIVITCHKPW